MKTLLLAVSGLVCLGQSFEVASIHRHEGVVKMSGLERNGPLITFNAMTPADLILHAFGIRDFQLDGGPSWMKSERYDINARATGEAGPAVADMRRMEQAMLAERFGLQFHRASREMPVYALVPAKPGSKLKSNESGPGGILFRRPTQESPTEVVGTGATVADLVRSISGIPGIDRPVVDRTGLAGKYDFTLTLLYGFRVDKTGPTATGPDGESVFTAIEEQLGLKLEQQRLPVEMFVVDRMEKPSAN
jgi:uncharacterized protein (TIGR03435 family)